jgi:3-methyladenine DNA glycosylase AlkC
VIEVPQRHDLVPNSCVNSEVLMFNRKLKQLKKVYPNLTVVSVDTARDFFTRSGFHLNSLGKEHAARRVVSVIIDLLNTNQCL